MAMWMRNVKLEKSDERMFTEFMFGMVWSSTTNAKKSLTYIYKVRVHLES